MWAADVLVCPFRRHPRRFFRHPSEGGDPRIVNQVPVRCLPSTRSGVHICRVFFCRSKPLRFRHRTAELEITDYRAIVSSCRLLAWSASRTHLLAYLVGYVDLSLHSRILLDFVSEAALIKCTDTTMFGEQGRLWPVIWVLSCHKQRTPNLRQENIPMKTVLSALLRKPIETLSALVLLGSGTVLAALMNTVAWQVTGSIMAALGGALLSYTGAATDIPDKARNILRSELEMTTRHLMDVAGKISRTVQTYHAGGTTSEIALDRIAQSTTYLYGAVNDLHIVSGSRVSSEEIIDTVTNCEELARQLEDLTARSGGHTGEDAKTIAKVREQLDSIRLKFQSARRSFGDPGTPKQLEQVKCPVCATVNEVRLGAERGDSAITTCIYCGERYHIHRAVDGSPFTRSWGAASSIARVISKCPHCTHDIPINFRGGIDIEIRYCMNCSARLKINRAGDILESRPGIPASKARVSLDGDRVVLSCPRCEAMLAPIWSNSAVHRAVCKACDLLIEGYVLIDEQGPADVAQSSAPPIN